RDERLRRLRLPAPRASGDAHRKSHHDPPLPTTDSHVLTASFQQQPPCQLCDGRFGPCASDFPETGCYPLVAIGRRLVSPDDRSSTSFLMASTDRARASLPSRPIAARPSSGPRSASLAARRSSAEVAVQPQV